MGEEEEEGLHWAQHAIHLVCSLLALFGLWRAVRGCCGCCCCRRRAEGLSVAEARGQGLRLKLRKTVAYACWGCGGVFGLHHFYLGRILQGCLMAVSLGGFFGVFWLVDLIFLPSYVRTYNRQCRPDAPYDPRGCCRLFCSLSVVLVLACSSLFMSFALGPRGLHLVGVVDLDAPRAGTRKNPYDLLGVPRGAGVPESNRAYRQLSVRWHPDKNPTCGEECEEKMAELSKAFKAIKAGHTADGEDVDFTKDSFWEGVAQDWSTILQAAKQVFPSSQLDRRAEYRRRLVGLFRDHAPEMEGEVDRLLDKWQGREHSVYVKFCKDYGVYPLPELGGNEEL